MSLKKATTELIDSNLDEVEGWLEDMATPECPAWEIYNRLVQDEYEMFFTFTGEGRLIGIVILFARDDGVLVLVGAAGNVWNEWDELHEQFATLARERGLDTVEFRGRRGFLRTFKKFGMTEKYTVMQFTV